MDSKLRKMAILASMAVILLVALLVMYVNREQFTAASGPARRHPALRMPERVTVHLRRKMAIRQKRRSHRMVRSAMI